LEEKDIHANIAFNPRKAGITERDEYFDEQLYQRRAFCEHTFAWMDGFKGLLIRYETLASTWLAMNLMGMIHLFLRKISKHISENP
jgi:transposase